jgi:hypothetical protein
MQLNRTEKKDSFVPKKSSRLWLTNGNQIRR